MGRKKECVLCGGSAICSGSTHFATRKPISEFHFSRRRNTEIRMRVCVEPLALNL